MQQGGEPSIEEILASIKKVMAREDAGPHGTADSIEPADDEEAIDVLDLEAHMLVADTPAAGQPEWTEAGPSYLAVDPPTGSAAPPRRDAASAIRESLAALERLSRAGSSGEAGSPADASLEAITREMLRPMLAEWLDANLPAIVERLVQAEIARIVERDR